MHILECIKSADSKVAAFEIVFNEMSHLLVRMYDFKQTLPLEWQQETIECCRNDLTFIRNAVDKILGNKVD